MIDTKYIAYRLNNLKEILLTGNYNGSSLCGIDKGSLPIYIINKCLEELDKGS